MSGITSQTKCYGVRFDPIGIGLIVDFLRENRLPKAKIPPQISKAPAPMNPVSGFIRMHKKQDVITKEMIDAASRGPRIAAVPSDDEIIKQYGYTAD
jgi:hypothetical protein